MSCLCAEGTFDKDLRMRIKRIDLCGFKSFSDKAGLELREQITGVVGPNGCGKSNIVDALRWAMGEQSARHLRGKSMEDVIFNGSESRGPSGVAEISITFENDGRVPVEYLSYNEITVTRSLHRDGTSEYSINRLPVRLRDVTNLFLGTGVGTKAYSIIEQGRVGMIVSAKPEDRRYFLEEAAGITKYRRRQQAATRKMEATQQNLLRVSDIVSELEKRLGSLRRQAKKAERYREYREEMRSIEMRAAAHELLELTAEGKFNQATLDAVVDRRCEAELGVATAEAKLENARLGVADVDREIATLQESVYQLENEVKLTENSIAHHTQEVHELRERDAKAAAEIGELENAESDAERQLESVQADYETHRLRQARVAESLAAFEATYATMHGDLEDIEAALESEREQSATWERCASDATAELRELSQRQVHCQERCQELSQERETLVERLASLGENAVEVSGLLQSLRQGRAMIAEARARAAEQLRSLEDREHHGSAELEVLQTELHRRRSRLASLEEIQRRYEGFDRGTRAIMQRYNGDSRERGILGVVAEYLGAPPEYETALEAVLGQRLGAVIVEDNSITVDSIEYLKSNDEGRSSFIPRSGALAASVLAAAPVGTVWDAQTGGQSSMGLQEAGGGAQPVWVDQEEREHRTAVDALPGVRGQLVDLVSCSGEYENLATALLKEVVVVESLVAGLEIWPHCRGKTLVTLDGELLSPDGTVTGGSADAEQGGVLRQRREISELTDIIEQLDQQYERAFDAHVALKTEIKGTQDRLHSATRRDHETEKDIIGRDKDLNQLNAQTEALRARLHKVDAELLRLGEDAGRIAESNEKAEKARDEAAAEQRLARDTVALLNQARKHATVRCERARQEMTDCRVLMAQIEANCEATAESLRSLERARVERRQRIGRLRDESQRGRARCEQLGQKLARLEENLRDKVTDSAKEQSRLEEQRAIHAERMQQAEQLECQMRELRQSVGEITQQASTLELRRSELRMGLSNLEARVWERYRESLPSVAGDYHLLPRISEAETERLGQLAQLIARMGEVNLTAIEEFAEVNQRYEFLVSHKKDLEGALVQLQRAISRINRTCRHRFLETFEAVNKRFQSIFPRLFNGGRAKLVLTGSEAAGDDVLNKAGVDVVAQPPGKKLQSLDMMSGGEKALTAVSLIFAMFQVKPTPFCLLDEVDAPLDEANVIRFREIVREMSKQSQFIIITHNRRTMEIADQLYGVTMEEPGISRLVSVNLNEAAQAVAN